MNESVNSELRESLLILALGSATIVLRIVKTHKSFFTRKVKAEKTVLAETRTKTVLCTRNLATTGHAKAVLVATPRNGMVMVGAEIFDLL
jgi:hypothetical protein